MFPYFRLAFLNLTLQKRRSFLLGLAVASVTFLLLFMLSFVGGVSSSLIDGALSLSSGHVNIGGFYKTRADRAQAVVTDKTKLIELIEQNISGLDRIEDRGRGWGRVISSKSSLNAGLIGLTSNSLDQMKAVKIIEPTPIPNGATDWNRELFDSGLGVILFAGQAKRLEVGVGESITYITEGNGSLTNTVDLTVVAIASDLGFLSNFSLLTHQSTVRHLYQFNEDTAGAIHIYLDDIKRANEVTTQLRQVLSNAGYEIMEADSKPFFMKFRRVISESWKGQKLDVTIWKDEVAFLYWIVASLQTLSIFLIGVLGMIIAIGVANTTWMTVRERTREMGTLRAIGMQTRQVLILFLIEAIMLGFFSSGIGAIASTIATTMLDSAKIPVPSADLKAFLMSDYLRFSLTSLEVVFAIAVISLLTGLAAAYPAWKASRMNPVSALNHST